MLAYRVYNRSIFSNRAVSEKCKLQQLQMLENGIFLVPVKKYIQTCLQHTYWLYDTLSCVLINCIKSLKSGTLKLQ